MKEVWTARRFSLVFIAVQLLAIFSARSQSVFYVRAGATGANNGTDWVNAYVTLPASLQRGAVYYMAGGNYLPNGRNFTDPDSGASTITIRRAITTDHGTSVGWNDTYDSQVVFGTSLEFWTDYYVFDGQSRSSWTNGYGIKIQYSGATQNDVVFGTTNPSISHHNKFRYVEIQGSGARDGSINDRGIYHTAGCHDITMEYCYIHDTGNCSMISRDVRNMTNQFCYFSRNHSDAVNHGEGWSISGNCTNVVDRWNYWVDIEGTAVICTPTVGHPQCGGPNIANWYIYGDVFVHTSWGTANGVNTGNGLFYLFDCSAHGDIFFYNNTVVNFNRNNGAATFIGCDNTGAGNACAERFYVRNNLFYGSTAVAQGSGNVADWRWEYNAYFSQTSSDTDPNRQNVSGVNPFINTNSDFHLNLATANGTALASPFNTDGDGNLRGGDGVWDRGAFDFNGTPSTNPPVISAVGTSSVGATNAVVNWTTDKLSTSVVQYGLTTTYGSTVSNGTLVQSHAVTLPGLTPTTTYHYRVISADSAGRTTNSADFTFQTTLLDLTPPTVVLNSPADGALVSNNVPFTVTATDVGGLGVVSVAYTVDGVTALTSSTSPYGMTWDSRTIANGSHTIQALALDLAGNLGVSVTATITVQNSTAPSGSPVGYWTFDEPSGTTALDASAYGNNGTLLNNPARVPGILGGALQLDGVAAYVRVPNATMLRVTNAFTISAWVQLSANGQWQVIASKLNAEGANASPFCDYAILAVDVGTGFNARVAMTTGGTFNSQDSTAVAAYGTWHHIAGVYNGSTLSIYVDGVLSGSRALTGAVANSGQPLYIGHNGAGGDSTKGVVDEVRVYSRALTAVEIQNLSNGPRPSAPSNLRLM